MVTSLYYSSYPLHSNRQSPPKKDGLVVYMSRIIIEVSSPLCSIYILCLWPMISWQTPLNDDLIQYLFIFWGYVMTLIQGLMSIVKVTENTWRSSLYQASVACIHTNRTTSRIKRQNKDTTKTWWVGYPWLTSFQPDPLVYDSITESPDFDKIV